MNSRFQPAPYTQLITMSTVRKRTGRAVNTIRSWVHNGDFDFPQPKQIDGMQKCWVWVEAEIEAWIAEHPELIKAEEEK